MKGLLARGGFTVDIYWDSEARLVNATISSQNGGSAVVTVGWSAIGASDATTLVVEGTASSGGMVLLEYNAGKSYTVSLK